MRRWMQSTSSVWRAACLATLAVNTAQARDKQISEAPKAYSGLMACRSIVDGPTRLACFDRQATQLDAAARSREVVIADREAVESAQRGLFGFAAPVGKLLGFGSDQEEIKQIETKVARVGHTGDGGWRLTMEDGGIWEQIDTRSFVLAPKLGDAVNIKRGALGSFFVAVRGQRAIKMRRVQ